MLLLTVCINYVSIYFKTSNETELDLNDNPAYATKTIRQRDLAHGVTNISKGTELSQAVTDELVPTYETVLPSSAQIETRHGSQSGKDMNQQEPTYEIVQQPSAQVSGQKKEDEYDKLNRELL